MNRLFIILYFILAPFLVALGGAVHVNQFSSHKAFYEHIHYLECEPGQFTIDDFVQNNEFPFHLVPLGINFAYPTRAYWLYFDIVNTDTVPSEQFLSLDNPNLNQIRLYQSRNGVITDSTHTGEGEGFEMHEVDYVNFLFPLQLAPKDSLRVYVYLFNDSDEIFVPISINPPHRFIEENLDETYYRVFRAGILVFVLIGVFFLYIVTRTRISLYFLLYVLSVTLYLTSAWGLTQQYLWPDWTFMSVRFSPICVNFTIIFAQLFNQKFLSTKRNSTVAHWITRVLLWISFASLFTFFVPSNLLFIPQGSVIIMATIASFIAPTIGGLCFKKAKRESFYIILSSLPIFITVGLYILRFYGFVRVESLLVGFDTAIVIEIIVLMFGIIDQFRMQQITHVQELSIAGITLQEQKLQLERSNEVLTHTIAEKEAIQEKLLQVHKLETIGKLAGGIAHDFNNLLTPIIGYTEMGMDSLDKDSELYEDLGVVLKSSKRAKELVNQILTFSKHFKEQVQQVSLLEIVDEVLKLLKSVIPSSVIINHRYDEDDDPYILADPTQIHQILMNICTNAYHAIGDKQGMITVEHINTELNGEQITRLGVKLLPGNYVQINITDTGKGMDSYTIAKVFDPFFTTKDKGKGTGLGLSVVHGIVKKLNGCIKVISEEGVGTTFSVYLPTHAPTFDDTVPELEKIAHGNGQVIMLVDDEESVLSMIEKLLARNGYRTLSFLKSDQALEYFQAHSSDIALVITDQTMPILKGNELAQRIVEMTVPVPVLLITGYSETVTVNNYQEFGIDSLMLKPIVPNKLLKEVARLLTTGKVTD